MEIISKIVEAGSLDTILRDYNKELIKTAFDRAQSQDEDKLLLFKYLSYLSQSIIMWFENNYPEIFHLGHRVWVPVISSLILESLPLLDARVARALNNMIQFLSSRLYPPNIRKRPIQIAREAVDSGLYDESFRTDPLSVTVNTITTGGDQMYIDIDGLWGNIRTLEVERQDLLQNDNVTRFLPVSAEGGGGGGGGSKIGASSAIPPPVSGPVQVNVNDWMRAVFSKAREGISGIAFLNWAAMRRIINRAGVLCDSNGNALTVSADGPHFGFLCDRLTENEATDRVIHYWRTSEPEVALWGGGATRRKTRKKKKRKRKKTRRRRKKHKRKTRRKR